MFPSLWYLQINNAMHSQRIKPDESSNTFAKRLCLMYKTCTRSGIPYDEGFLIRCFMQGLDSNFNYTWEMIDVGVLNYNELTLNEVLVHINDIKLNKTSNGTWITNAANANAVGKQGAKRPSTPTDSSADATATNTPSLNGVSTSVDVLMDAPEHYDEFESVSAPPPDSASDNTTNEDVVNNDHKSVNLVKKINYLLIIQLLYLNLNITLVLSDRPLLIYHILLVDKFPQLSTMSILSSLIAVPLTTCGLTVKLSFNSKTWMIVMLHWQITLKSPLKDKEQYN